MSSANITKLKAFHAVSAIFLALLTVVLLLALTGGEVDASKSKTAATSKKLPVITKVTPRTELFIGQKVTITGRNFVKGKNKVLFVFQRDGSKRRFTVRGKGLSTTKATAEIPDVGDDLVRARPDFTPLPTDNMYRMRAITKYGASKRLTSATISPLILPNTVSTKPLDKTGAGDCDDDGQLNNVDADDDNDLLADTIELTIGTDVCLKDTDGDEPTDYYEYRVAFEYNNSGPNFGAVLPYPGLRPYPNPLVPDAGSDFDNDFLTVAGEFKAWQYTGRMDRFYSDADQDSDDDGIKDYAEDEDNDLLPNLTEALDFQRGSPPRPLNWLRTDTDGDGLCDGLDDQDHDGPPTAVAVADCSTPVPNNGLAGTPPSLFGAGDPNPALIDGDDNEFSNYYEWMINEGLDGAVAAYEPCDPDPNGWYCLNPPDYFPTFP